MKILIIISIWIFACIFCLGFVWFCAKKLIEIDKMEIKEEEEKEKWL